MKLRELGKWVGLHGTTLRRRARVLGYEYKLEDSLTVIEAGKLYRQLPVEKVMTITYQDARKPKVEFIGSWNINDWHRLFKKVQRDIMVRNRDFIRAARKNGQPEQVEDELKVTLGDKDLSVSEPLVEITQEIYPDPRVKPETVSKIAALVEADAQAVGTIPTEEYDYARGPSSENSTRPRTSAIPSDPAGADSGGDDPGSDHAGGNDPGSGLARHPGSNAGSGEGFEPAT